MESPNSCAPGAKDLADTDSDLVAASRAGDALAFNRIVERYFGRVFAVAQAAVRNPEGAEDLAQEALLRAFIHLEKLDQPERLGPWLVQIARNLALDRCRSDQRARKGLRMLSLDDEDLPEIPDSSSETPRERLEREQHAALVRDALDRLPTELREVLLLHYAEGLNKAEIGRLLGLHDSNVGRQISRGLEALRREMSPALADSLRQLRPSRKALGRAAAAITAYAALDSTAKAAVAATAALPAALQSAAQAGAASSLLSFTSTGAVMSKAKVAGATMLALLTLGGVGSYLMNQQVSGGSRPEPKEERVQSGAPQPANAAQPPSKEDNGRLVNSPGRQADETSTLTQIAEKLRITGVVVNEQNEPVKDAEVFYGNSGLGGNVQTVLRTTTTLAGRFTLAGVAEEAGVVHVDSPHYLPETVTPTKPGDNLTVQLRRGGASVTGHVYSWPERQGLGGATVALMPVGDTKAGKWYRRPRMAVADSLGAFRLDQLLPGQWRATAFKSDLGLIPGQESDYEVALEEQKTVTGLEFFLYAGHTAVGQVVDRVTSQPLAGAVLKVPAYGPTGSRERTIVADGEGRYRASGIFGLRDQKTYFSVSKEDYDSQTVELDLDLQKLQIERDVQLDPMLTISGRVVTYDGTSIPGAAVSLVDFRLPNSSEGAFESFPAGDDGTFKLVARPNGKVIVAAEAPGFGRGYSQQLLLEAKPVGDVLVRLAEPVSLSGTVVDSKGTPVEGAKVLANQEIKLGVNIYRRPVDKVVTGADGRFRFLNLPATDPSAAGVLAAGKGTSLYNLPPLSLQVAKNGYVNWSDSVKLKPGESRHDLLVKLQDASFLGGKITNKKGEPIPGVSVRAHGLGGDSAKSTISDEEGNYRLEGLPPGFLSVTVYHNDSGEDSQQNVQAGRTDVNFVLGAEGAELVGQVVDWRTGKPVSEYDVKVGTGVFDVRKQANGTFTARIVANKYLLHRVVVRVSPEESCTREFQVPEGTKTVEQIFRVGPGGSVSGRVVEKESGKPLAGVQVEVYDGSGIPSPGEYAFAKTATDDDGKFLFDKLGQQDYMLYVKPEAPLTVVTKSFSVDHGKTAELGDLEVGKGGTLKVRVVNMPDESAAEDVLVTITSDYSTGRMEQAGKTDSSGVVEFSGLTNQRYSVTLDSSSINTSVQLEQDETREVVLKVGSGTLLGRIVLGGQPTSAYLTLSRTVRGPRTTLNGKSDGSGIFRFDNITPGGWEVTIATGQRVLEDWVEVRAEGVTEKTFEIPADRLAGRVVDSQGEPAAGALVQAMPVERRSANDIFSPQRAGSTTAGADGQFALEGLTPGTYNVTALLGSERADAEGVRAGSGASAAPLELRLAPTGGGTLVSVTYNMDSGNPMRTPYCVITGPDGPFPHNAERDAQGAMRIPGLPPGKYRTLVSAPGYSSHEHEVEITEGAETRIDDVLSAGGSMRWLLKDSSGHPVAGAECTLTPDDPASIETVRRGNTDADGLWAARGLVPGSYTATARSGEAVATEKFEIPPKGHDEKEGVLAGAL